MNSIRYTLSSMWLYGPAVITVMLSYFMLTNLAQGRDVVMIAGEKLPAFIAAIFAVVTWAFFVWYSCRIIGYQKRFVDPTWPIPFASTFPRLLAYNAYVSVQAAILALPTVLNLGFWWLLVFVAAHNAFYFLLAKAMDKERTRSSIVLALVVGGGYLIFVLLQTDPASTHQQNLPLVCALLFLLQVASLFFFIWRRVAIDKKALSGQPEDAVGYVKFLSFRLVKVPAWFVQQEQLTFTVFHIVAIIAVIVYCLAFASIDVADKLAPLAIVLLAFGVLSGAANMVTHRSLQSRFNWFVALLFLAWVAGLISDPYRVRKKEADQQNSFSNRPDLKTYFYNWVEARKNLLQSLDSGETFPVYFVLADGGASRSGYWVASVLAAWEDESVRENPTAPFSRHLFCLSGASGGSVGNAVFYSLLKKSSGDNFLVKTRDFLSRDFLSHSVAHYMGPDLLRHFFPILPFGDRAGAIEETMEKWSQQYLGGAFGEYLSDTFNNDAQFPILCINTTRVQEGTPSVVSSVKLDGFSRRLDVLHLLDTLDEEKGYDIRLSTAAILGARFPYISPAGCIGDSYFVDGGYFDNSGAGIVQEMLAALNTIVRKDTSRSELYSKLRFKVVHIINSPLPGEVKPIHPFTNDLAAPLLTVFNTYASQTEVNDKRLEDFMLGCERCDSTVSLVNLYRNLQDDPEENYPMNWVISDYQLMKMDRRLEEVKQDKLKELMKY